MLRRSFFKSISSNLILLVLPRWARAQTEAATQSAGATWNEVASAVLPGSLGAARIEEIAANFEQWVRNYPAGADAGYGYGFTHPRKLGPNPSLHYAEQLSQIGAAAAAKGLTFAALSDTGKRAIVENVLAAAGVTSIPNRPSGQHVATDLMSFFYNSSAGEDFCYNAAIRRDACRGLASSANRPAPLV